MSCRYCKDDNKIVRTLAWAVYLAPLAYSAYVFLKQTGALDKAKEYVEPAENYLDDALAQAKEFVKKHSDKVTDVVTEVVKGDVDTSKVVDVVKDVDGKKK